MINNLRIPNNFILNKLNHLLLFYIGAQTFYPKHIYSFKLDSSQIYDTLLYFAKAITIEKYTSYLKIKSLKTINLHVVNSKV